MTNKFKLNLFTLILGLLSAVSMAQTPEPAKPATADPAKQEDEFAKKKAETKLTEVITTDSMPAGDLSKRAVAWMKVETDKYRKTNATTSGNKIECLASFPVKPKELNPEVQYTGKVTMKVVIECKDAKYRYTVSDIKHISKTGTTSGGSIDNAVPECGSMAMNEIVWRKLRSEMLKGAAQVVVDLKAGMAIPPSEDKGDEW